MQPQTIAPKLTASVPPVCADLPAGKQVAVYRSRMGLTVTQFAKQVRVSEATLRRIETCEIAPVEIMLRLALALGLSPAAFTTQAPAIVVASEIKKREVLSALDEIRKSWNWISQERRAEYAALWDELVALEEAEGAL